HLLGGREAVRLGERVDALLPVAGHGVSSGGGRRTSASVTGILVERTRGEIPGAAVLAIGELLFTLLCELGWSGTAEYQQKRQRGRRDSTEHGRAPFRSAV